MPMPISDGFIDDEDEVCPLVDCLFADVGGVTA